MWQYPEIQLTIWNIIWSGNTSKNVKHFFRVQIQDIFIIINYYLGTVVSSCFSVSMSVNWTACPPPLVLMTSP